MRLGAISLVISATLLSGCSEKQEANTTLPSTTSAPTVEALPPLGPADFPVPDEARTQDAAGAEAFVRYWIELLNRQQAIPSGQPLRDLSSPECDECSRIAGAFDDAAAAGHRYEGGELSLNDVAEPLMGDGEAAIAFGVRVQPLTVRAPTGSPVPGGVGELVSNAGSGMRLAWSEESRSWIITRMTIG
ncbi:hypothetical protein DQ239_17400 [Blastococcus sp. TF02-09]|nr:hypothetical protein DQ239_17400 [Blastococcus sp. TF02-9]